MVRRTGPSCEALTKVLFARAAQADKIVGLGAPEDVLQQLKDVALSHHTQLEVDSLRAYHTGGSVGPRCLLCPACTCTCTCTALHSPWWAPGLPAAA